MASLKVEIDPRFKDVQIYGTYRYNTQLGAGECLLSKVSKRKHYPDVLSRGRSESCILDAIANYKAELKAQYEAIKKANLANGR